MSRRPIATSRRFVAITAAMAVAVVSLAASPQLRAVTIDLARWVREGFVAVYVDAGTFIAGCF